MSDLMGDACAAGLPEKEMQRVDQACTVELWDVKRQALIDSANAGMRWYWPRRKALRRAEFARFAREVFANIGSHRG